MNGCVVVIAYFGPSIFFFNSYVVGTVFQGLYLCGALFISHDFSFTGIEGCLVLTDEFPRNRSARAADEKPDRERNLNSSRGVPSSYALTNWPPHQASQKAVSWWHYDGEGHVFLCMPPYCDDVWNGWILLVLMQTWSGPICHIYLYSLDIWERELRPFNFLGCGSFMYESKNFSTGVMSG